MTKVASAASAAAKPAEKQMKTELRKRDGPGRSIGACPPADAAGRNFLEALYRI
ncbi:MAG TPA: hypothetical protein VM364_02950 [Vicinamibacterales bacterium]|nr:hypothetical protein [Vicinamibacterales bacterium]